MTRPASSVSNRHTSFSPSTPPSVPLARRAKSLATSTESRLDGADGRLQHRRGLVEREVEHVLQQHRGALLRRQAEEEDARRLAHRDRLRRILALARRRCGAFRVASLDARAAEPVDPEVRRGADEVGARMGQVGVALPEEREDACERVLHQVLAVPHVAGEPAAVAEQLGAKRCDLVEEGPPGASHVGLDGELRLLAGHRPSPFSFVSTRDGP